MALHLHNNEIVAKFSSRRVSPAVYDRVLLSDDARFVVTVQAQTNIIVWRMVSCSDSGQQASEEYLTGEGPFDDEQEDDEVYFDEKIREYYKEAKKWKKKSADRPPPDAMGTWFSGDASR